MSEFQFFEYNGKQLPCFKNEESRIWMVPLCVFQNMIAPEGDTEIIESELESIFPSTYKMKAEEMNKMKVFLDKKTENENDFEQLHREKTIKLAAPLALLKKNKYFDTSNAKEVKIQTTDLKNSNACEDQDKEHPTQIPKVSSSSNSYPDKDLKTHKEDSGKSFYQTQSLDRLSHSSRNRLKISSCSDDTFSESEYSDKYYKKIVSQKKRKHHSKELPKSFVSNDSISKTDELQPKPSKNCTFEHVMEDFDQKVLSQSSKEEDHHHSSPHKHRHRNHHHRRSPDHWDRVKRRSKSREFEYNYHSPYYRRFSPFRTFPKDRYFRPYGDRVFYDYHHNRTHDRFYNSYRDHWHYNDYYPKKKRYIPIKRNRENVRKRSSSKSKSKSPKPAKPQKELPRIAGEKSALISAKPRRKSVEKPSTSTEPSMKVIESDVPKNVSDLVKMFRNQTENLSATKSQNAIQAESITNKKVKLDKSKISKSTTTEELMKQDFIIVDQQSNVASNKRLLSSNSTSRSDTTIDSGIDEKCDDIVIKEKSIKVDSLPFNQTTETKWPLEKSFKNVDPFSNFFPSIFSELLSAPNFQPITNVTDKIRNEIEFNNFNMQIENIVLKSSPINTVIQTPSGVNDTFSTVHQSFETHALPIDLSIKSSVKSSSNTKGLLSQNKNEPVVIHTKQVSSENDNLNQIIQKKEITQLEKSEQDIQKQPLSWKKALLEKAKQSHTSITFVKDVVQDCSNKKLLKLEEHAQRYDQTNENKTSFDGKINVIPIPSSLSSSIVHELLQQQPLSGKDFVNSPQSHNTVKPDDDVLSTSIKSNLPNSHIDSAMNDINTNKVISTDGEIQKDCIKDKGETASIKSTANEKIGNKLLNAESIIDSKKSNDSRESFDIPPMVNSSSDETLLNQKNIDDGTCIVNKVISTDDEIQKDCIKDKGESASIKYTAIEKIGNKISNAESLIDSNKSKDSRKSLDIPPMVNSSFDKTLLNQKNIDDETCVGTAKSIKNVKSQESFVELPPSVGNILPTISDLHQPNSYYHGIMEIDMKAPVVHFLKYLHPDDQRTKSQVVLFAKRRIPYMQIKNNSITNNAKYQWKYDTTMVRVRDVAFVLKWPLVFTCEQMKGLDIPCSLIPSPFIKNVYSTIYSNTVITDDILLHCMGYTQPPIMGAEGFLSLDHFLNRLIPKMFYINFSISKTNLCKYVNVRTYQPINYLNADVTNTFSKSFLYNVSLVREDVAFMGKSINNATTSGMMPTLPLPVTNGPKKRKLSSEKKIPPSKSTRTNKSKDLSSNSSSAQLQLHPISSTISHRPVNHVFQSISVSGGHRRLSSNAQFISLPIVTHSNTKVVSNASNSPSVYLPTSFPSALPHIFNPYALQQKTSSTTLTQQPISPYMLTVGKSGIPDQGTSKVVASNGLTIPSFDEFRKYVRPTTHLNANNSSNHYDEQLHTDYQKIVNHSLQVNLCKVMPQQENGLSTSVANEKQDITIKTESVDNKSFFEGSKEPSDTSELVIGSIYTMSESNLNQEMPPVTTSEFFTNPELRNTGDENISDKDLDSSTLVSKLSSLKNVLIEAEKAVQNVNDKKKTVSRRKCNKANKEMKSNLSEVVKKLEERINEAP